jgi:hypothetical protein
MKLLSLVCFLTLPLGQPAASAVVGRQDASPAEQFKALMKEYNRSTSAYKAEMTDEERTKFVGDIYRHHFEVGVKFVELAEKYPNDPIALDALIQAAWQVNTMPWPVSVAGEDHASEKAIELIIKNHVRSERLAPLCERVSYGFRKEYESLLRAVAKSSPHKPVRAAATLALAQYIYNRSQRVELLRGFPAFAREFAELYGEDYMAELFRRKPAAAENEAANILGRSMTEFGTEPVRSGGTVAEAAKSLLYEIRHLAIGKPAPETEGVDANGVRFKLSDYRGKVVLLDFFSYV